MIADSLDPGRPTTIGPVAKAMLEDAARLRAEADKLERAAGYLDESPVTTEIIERTRQLIVDGKIPLMPHETMIAKDAPACAALTGRARRHSS